MKSLISLLLIVGILNLKLERLKFNMVLKEIMESQRDATVVKLVNILNREMPSLFSGKLPVSEDGGF